MRPLHGASHVLLLGLLGLPACSSCSEEPQKKPTHETVAPDDAIRHVGNLDDQALLDRAKRSHDCGFFEENQCNDPAIIKTRCELALRAADRKVLFDTLLADAKSADPKLRGYAVRVLAFRSEAAAVDLVDVEISSEDKTRSCPAARYGMYFRAERAKRLAELAKLCDTVPQLKREEGDPVIRLAADRTEKGKGIVRVPDGDPCE